MTSSTTARLIAVGVLAALVLTSCSGGEDAPDAATSASASSEPTASSAGSGAAAPSAVPSSAETSGIDPQNPPEAIASATIPAVAPQQTDPGASLRVDLLSLRRSGELVVATFAFTPTSTDDSDGWLYDWLGNQGWEPYLVDTENLRRHDVVRGEGGAVFASAYQGSKFASGQTWYAYAGFAAPPEGVTTMDVAAVDGAPVFTAVPVS